jgi:hypothetical protein
MKDKANIELYHHAVSCAMYFGRKAGLRPYMCRVSGCGDLRFLQSEMCQGCIKRNRQDEIAESDSHSSDSEDEHTPSDDKSESEAPQNGPEMRDVEGT